MRLKKRWWVEHGAVERTVVRRHEPLHEQGVGIDVLTSVLDYAPLRAHAENGSYELI